MMLAVLLAFAIQTAPSSVVVAWDRVDSAAGYFVFTGPTCGDWTNISNTGAETTITLPAVTKTCIGIQGYFPDGSRAEMVTIRYPWRPAAPSQLIAK